MVSLISWQMIEPALQNVVLALGSVAIGYVINFVRKHTKLAQWQRESGIKSQIIRDMILFAQQTCADLSNSSKFTVAFEETSKKLKANGINVTDDELKQSIEATLKQLKSEAGQQWAANQNSGQ